MARKDLRRLVHELGTELGQELGRIVGESLARSLEAEVEARGLSDRLLAARRPRKHAACSAEGCDGPVLAKGLCRSHYYRARYERKKAP